MVLGTCPTSTGTIPVTPTGSTKDSVLPVLSFVVSVARPHLAHMSRAVVQEQGSMVPGS